MVESQTPARPERRLPAAEFGPSRAEPGRPGESGEVEKVGR